MAKNTEQNTPKNSDRESELDTLVEKYEKYFVPNVEIPEDRFYMGHSLQQPELHQYVDVITVYDSTRSSLTF